MFNDLSPEILASMSTFPALVNDDPRDPRCTAVAAAIEKIAGQLANWMAEPDPGIRQERQVLHAGFSAAAEICRSVIEKHDSKISKL